MRLGFIMCTRYSFKYKALTKCTICEKKQRAYYRRFFFYVEKGTLYFLIYKNMSSCTVLNDARDFYFEMPTNRCCFSVSQSARSRSPSRTHAHALTRDGSARANCGSPSADLRAHGSVSTPERENAAGEFS